MTEDDYTEARVVTHQHSSGPAIKKTFYLTEGQKVVTHQHSSDPAILQQVRLTTHRSRNSPTF